MAIAALCGDYAAILLIMVVVAMELALPQGQMYMLPTDVPEDAYPLLDETVPIAALVVGSIIITVVAYGILVSMKRMTSKEAWRAFVCVTLAVLWSQAVTELLKKTVGRPRPDFFGRCIGNKHLPPVLLEWDSPGYPKCTGSPEVMHEAYKSFPSGHSTFAFASLTQLTFMFIRQLDVLGSGSSAMSYVFAFAPSLAAAWIAATRVKDAWHWPTDVVAGGLIGTAVSITVCLNQYGSILPPSKRQTSDQDPEAALTPNEGNGSATRCRNRDSFD